MWLRLGGITALVSVLATFFGLLYQLQLVRKECPADLSLLKCVEEIPFPSTPKSEWEREVRYTENEERIEDFINKYKEGPYVTLAQERLQVAQAWAPIKNTIDPHALSAFLSKYHDPVFEKLANDALQRLAMREWEREVKNTDSEEAIGKFIDRYKEGPYVTLAQERLQVAQAWAPIKNTIDPHALSAFLSKYHDPVFEKLAQNSLRRLDDRDWELALKKRMRDALATYVETWSAFSGRHIQEAQTKLTELDDDDAWKVASNENTAEAYRRYLANPSWTRHVAQARKQLDELNEAASKDDDVQRTYWSLYENDPEARCAGTSIMYSITEEKVVKFYYEIPSKCIQRLSVNKDALKFEGTKNGRLYEGKAYVFTDYCRGQSFGYVVSGRENNDHTLITLSGPAPVINIQTCRIHDLTPDSNNTTLEFKAREIGERETTAKAKPGNKPDQIRR